LLGSVCRCVEIDGSDSFDSASRVLGRVGSSSRITRKTSRSAASLIRFRVKGVLPVSSS
jgi:hypothetical protein